MRTSVRGLVVVLAVLIALPLMAGPGHKHKCDHPTQDCLDKMAAKLQAKGWVGIEGDWNEEKAAFKIEKVVAGSPAEEAGLQPGDVLVALNGIGLGDDKLKQAKSGMSPGDTVKYTVKRAGGKKVIAIKLGKMPEEMIARYVGEHLLQDHAAVAVASK
jgi:C-terminal processing protease CtpA/Prc